MLSVIVKEYMKGFAEKEMFILPGSFGDMSAPLVTWLVTFSQWEAVSCHMEYDSPWGTQEA